MRNVKVYHINSDWSASYRGQFPWLQNDGLRAAERWAARHGYQGPLICLWED